MSAFCHLIEMREVPPHILQQFNFEIVLDKHSQSYQRLLQADLFIVFSEKEG